MREGWICARCKASVSPDETTCPLCSSVQRQQIAVTVQAPGPMPIIKLCSCTSPYCPICHPNIYGSGSAVTITAEPIQGIN